MITSLMIILIMNKISNRNHTKETINKAFPKK